MKCNQRSNRVHTPFGDFQIDVDNLMDHFFNDRTQASPTAWSPRTTITESDTEYRLVMELAGVNSSDVSVEMKDGLLEISGEKKTPELEEGVKLLANERRNGDFRRSFEFSTQVDADRINAEFKHGLLTLVLPKSEKVLPRRIEINVVE